MTSGDRDHAGGAALVALDRLRGALWPLPCLGILVAVVLGVLLPAVDGRLGRSEGDLALLAFGGGASAARDLLAAIAASLISVTGLTFSLTVIALQLSSSQYSPRLLQTFVTDRVVQLTLAQLVLTFVYALTVLRSVRTEGATDADVAFVPRLSITLAYLLTLVSVVALVLFLGHLALALRVETMLRDVHREASSTISRELDRPEHDGADAAGAPETGRPAGDGVPLLARSSGFLLGLRTGVVAAARECDGVVHLAVRVGDAVVAGTPVAHAWPRRDGGVVDGPSLEAALDTALRLGHERSAREDVAYGLRKVVDIVVRALSPGLNDPTTAVHGLGHVSALVGELASRPAVARSLRDEDGVVRVVVPPWRLPALLQLAVEEPLQMAGGQPVVLRRLAGVLRASAWQARGRGVDDQLRGYADALAETALGTTGIDPGEVRSWRLHVDQALGANWPPQSP